MDALVAKAMGAVAAARAGLKSHHAAASDAEALGGPYVPEDAARDRALAEAFSPAEGLGGAAAEITAKGFRSQANQVVIDAVNYLNDTQAAADDDLGNEKGCGVSCMVTMLVDMATVSGAALGALPCPVFLLPLWWGLGVVTFMFDQGLSFTDSLYMLNQIVTTIGYGTHTPKSRGMQLFHALHSIVSATVVAPVTYELVDYMLDSFGNMPNVAMAGQLDGLHKAFYQMIVIMSVELFANVAEYKNLAKAFYEAIITATTIGYGDVTPGTNVWKWMHLALSPFLTSAMGRFAGAIGVSVNNMNNYGKTGNYGNYGNYGKQADGQTTAMGMNQFRSKYKLLAKCQPANLNAFYQPNYKEHMHAPFAKTPFPNVPGVQPPALPSTPAATQYQQGADWEAPQQS